MAACYGPFFAFVLFVILLLCLVGQTSRCDHLLGDERGGGEPGLFSFCLWHVYCLSWFVFTSLLVPFVGYALWLLAFPGHLYCFSYVFISRACSRDVYLG